VTSADPLDRVEAAGGAVDAQLSPELVALLRVMLGIVHEQARQLHAMRAELQAASTALAERKLIERAKGLLMAHRGLGEDEAYRALRRMAMNQKRCLAEVARSVLDMAEVVCGPRH